MRTARLALAGVAVGLVIGAASSPGDSTGQTADDARGLTYGGLKDQYAAWLRLTPGRRAISAMQMDWAVAPRRCSNGKTHSSALYAGIEELEPIDVRPDGSFQATIVDRYTYRGTRYEEHETVEGRVTGEIATGSISGRVRFVRPNGQVVRCNFGPQTWRLVD